MGEEEVPPAAEAGRLEDRLHHAPGGARIARRFEDDELAGAKLGGDQPGGGSDRGEIGLPVGAEWRRDADEDGIGLGQRPSLPGEAEAGCAQRGADRVGLHLADWAARRGELGDARPVGIHANGSEAGLDQGEDQRQADIAEADDGNRHLPSPEPRRKRLRQAGGARKERRERVRHAVLLRYRYI
jgi:hypothetical protein